MHAGGISGSISATTGLLFRRDDRLQILSLPTLLLTITVGNLRDLLRLDSNLLQICAVHHQTDCVSRCSKWGAEGLEPGRM